MRSTLIRMFEGYGLRVELADYLLSNQIDLTGVLGTFRVLQILFSRLALTEAGDELRLKWWD
jgi:hypothetical protein